MSDEPIGSDLENKLKAELVAASETFRQRALKKFIMAAIGAIPWVGGFIAAAAELSQDEGKVDDLQRQWLEEHRRRMEELALTLDEMTRRLQDFGKQVDERLSSDAFLELVRNGFRSWDAASSQEKRDYIRRLLTNAVASALCSDDLVQLFLDWIDRYHESHFKVIRIIYRNPGATRARIWQEIHGSFPREDSAEADLFKLLIHDLSLGHVIRQRRVTTHDGHFVKKATGGRRVGLPTMKSAFDDEDPYELTALGGQFVHYVMEEVVPRVADGKAQQGT